MIAQNGFMIAHKSIYPNIVNTVKFTYIYKMPVEKQERVPIVNSNDLEKLRCLWSLIREIFGCVIDQNGFMIAHKGIYANIVSTV